MISQSSGTTFNKLEINNVFELITSTDSQLKEYFEKYLFEEYNDDFSSRLYYLDISEISRFIVDKIKSKQADFLNDLFIKVEQILSDCDKEVEELIVVGLFEGLLNTAGSEVDYHRGFDKWILPLSKTKWDNLIDTWEGTNWRERKE